METTTQKSFFKTISGQTLIAIILGVLVGIFFGDDLQIIKPLGTIYLSLTQILIYPYMICTLLANLGRLSPEMSFDLLKRGWLIFIAFLIVCFAIIIVLATAIPISINFENADVPKTNSTSLFDLLLTTNVFAALSQNQLPAVIIFCILLAVTLQRIKNTGDLFRLLDVVSTACIGLWGILVKIAPYSVFVMVAYFSGTIKLNQISGASIYLLTLFIGSLVLALWIIPIMICNMTSMNYRDLMRQLRECLIICVSTVTPVLALPYIQKITANFLQAEETNTEKVIETNSVLGYVFSDAGPFFTYLFMIFAALYFNHPIPETDKLLLPIITFFSAISGSSGAVIYMTDWLHLPKETAPLFLSLLPLIQYNLALVSIMSITFFTLVISCAYANRLQIRPLHLLLHFILAGLVIFSVSHIRFWLADPATNMYHRLISFELNPNLTTDVQVKYMPPLDEAHLMPEKNFEDSFHRVQQKNTLRVGYNASQMPFSFFNNKQQLVGYDVAYMYQLAHDLGASIEFIPYTFPYLIKDLQANAFDIAIGGLTLDTSRLPYVAFTEPYIKSYPSFIVPDPLKKQFASMDTIQAIPNLKLGVLNSPIIIDYAKKHFPQAKIVILDNAEHAVIDAFKQHKIDGVLWESLSANPWILGHPGYAAVTPQEAVSPFLLSYLVPKQSPEFLNYLYNWLVLQENNGFKQKTYDQWILIHPNPDLKRRWSIARDILHWNL